MERDPQDPEPSEMYQNGMKDARTHINRQKSRNGIETPRTVAEQVEELAAGEDGHRLRDPVKAAEMQHQHRDNGVGGAMIDTTQGANEQGEDVYFEKLPQKDRKRTGTDVVS